MKELLIYFGWTVSISGNITIIGSAFSTINENSEQRAAHVFIQNGNIWSQQQKLISSAGKTGDNFGWSVSVSGNLAIYWISL